MVECRNSQLAPGARHQRAAQVALARLAHALSASRARPEPRTSQVGTAGAFAHFTLCADCPSLLFRSPWVHFLCRSAHHRQPWAGLLLLVLAGFLAWLLALSRPALVPSSRWIRLSLWRRSLLLHSGDLPAAPKRLGSHSPWRHPHPIRHRVQRPIVGIPNSEPQLSRCCRVSTTSEARNRFMIC